MENINNLGTANHFVLHTDLKIGNQIIEDYENVFTKNYLIAGLSPTQTVVTDIEGYISSLAFEMVKAAEFLSYAVSKSGP